MDAVIWEARPQLNRPVMVAAFEGWNDAADAASGAVTWLRRRLKATQIARIDPEEFYDFQSTRPEVSLIEGTTRKVSWPANECFSAHVEEVGRDLVLFSGVEPNLKWRTFCTTVIGLARETGCEMVVTLGALLADVPHTRPTRLTGTAVDPELIARLGLSHSRYEGPTGIVGVLHDFCRQAGMPSVSLWAPVPHYVASPPNPKATQALLERLSEVLAIPMGMGDLAEAAVGWEARVNELVGSDPDIAAYVRQLEERDDDQIDEGSLPSGDTLAAELEKYLRDQRPSD
ncbi:MAG TPA: PAC2 family protein [Acidimicrobiia bacterium]|nr:PAC2 family protein [Acidimicrobiia bacterium]